MAVELVAPIAIVGGPTADPHRVGDGIFCGSAYLLTLRLHEHLRLALADSRKVLAITPFFPM